MTLEGSMQKIANIALLIDADNASPTGIDAVLTVLAELGSVNVRRAYGNWAKSALSGWSSLAHQYAIEPQQQFDVTKGKSATDMKMIIDAMDLLYSGRIDGFGIMSSDSDFAPLVMRLRQHGLPVYGFGTSKTPVSFRQSCTRFIDVSQIQPMDSQNEHPSQPVDAEIIELLSDAWKASKRDEKGFAAVREVGQRAGNRSSFDVRNYGAQRLSDLFELLPNFQTERRENGFFVRRVN